MIERVEQLSSKLQFETLSQLDSLDKAQVQVPVVRRCEDVSPSAVLAGRRKTKLLREINPAGERLTRGRVCSDWFEQDWTGETLPREILKLCLHKILYTGT